MKTVPLITLPNEIEALMLAQRLEAEGIPSYVQPLGIGYGAFGVLPFIPHRVHVKEGDLERAREFLEGPEP